jgi:hypothetical protein
MKAPLNPHQSTNCLLRNGRQSLEHHFLDLAKKRRWKAGSWIFADGLTGLMGLITCFLDGFADDFFFDGFMDVLDGH